MTGFDRIVVGVDEGQLADSAVVAALHLSRHMHAPMTALHAVRHPGRHPWLEGHAKLKDLEEAALVGARKSRQSHLEQLLFPHATTPQEIEEMLHVSFGRPADVLAKHVNSASSRAALLVLGGHRHGGLFDFGGTARQMLSHLPGPMWVQGDQAWSKIRRILVAIDLSLGSRELLTMACAIAAAEEAQVTLLNCFESPNFAFPDTNFVVEEMRQRQLEELDRFVAEARATALHFDLRFEDADPAVAVQELQADHDLLAIGSHGHSALGGALLGGHAYQMICHARVPVLVMSQPRGRHVSKERRAAAR